MLITKRSDVTGKEHTLDIPLTEAQFNELNSDSTRLIQDIVPDLTPVQREFLMTGITPEEWAEIFPPEEEEENEDEDDDR